MIELRHLRTLLALKETGSLAGAAQKRFVTQSALSHQIKELETRLGEQLFIRKSKPISFTKAGEQMLLLADDILPRVQRTEDCIKEQQHIAKQKLLLGIPCLSTFKWIIPIVDAFNNSQTDVHIEVATQYGVNCLTALENNKIDIALTTESAPSHQLLYRHLFNFELKLLMPTHHPLAQKSFAYAEDLQDESLISFPGALKKSDVYRYFLGPANINIGMHKQCELPMMLMQRVASGDGVAILPEWSIVENSGLGVTTAPLGKYGLHRPLIGVSNPAHPHQASIQTCLTEITNRYQAPSNVRVSAA